MKIQHKKLLYFSIFFVFSFLIILRINLLMGYTDDSNSTTPKMFHTVADGPNSVISEDFDKDGEMDFAMANRDSDNILILFGKPDGTFRRGIFYEVGDGPESIISGDFYKDGNEMADLAVANKGFNSVSILINNGDGTFGNIIDYLVGDGPECIISDDLDEDGYLDLAVANSGSNNISILLNDGDGTFSEAKPDSLATGNSPKSITSADFNGDGNLDLAVANYDSDNIFIIPGKGDGTFSRAVNREVGEKPVSIISGDFYKDGNEMADLAVANSGSESVSIMINNGDGTFGNIINYSVGDSPKCIISDDLDEDGYLDLAVANSDSDSNNVSILINNGDGTFLVQANNLAWSRADSIFSADINKDGYADLAIVNSSSDYLSIFLNDKDGTFSYDADYVYEIGGTPESAISDDFDNDGYRDDLAIVNSGSNTLAILIGNGKESIFSEILFYLDLLGEDPKSIVSDYFNDDPNVDLAIANSGSNDVTILTGDGNGSFTQHDLIDNVGYFPVSIISARFNNDIFRDLAVANRDDNQLKIIFGNEEGIFDRNFYACATGDVPIWIISDNFDNDPNSVSDLAVANAESNNISVWLANEDYTVFDSAVNYKLGVSPAAITSADFNHDGKLDFASANIGSPTSHVTILLGNEDGTFSEEPVFAYAVVDEVTVEENNRKIEPSAIVSADFDNDNNLDLAVASSIINTAYDYDYVTIFFGNGNGSFGRGINKNVGDSPKSVISANFFAWNKADLAVVNSNGITIFQNEYLITLKPIPDDNNSNTNPPEPEEDLGGGICFISSMSSISLR
ncbi:MAG: FG-GAP repeat domain-containing protein [bacterium]